MLKRPILPKPLNEFDRVAFAGPMASGKTTLANLLVEEHKYTKVNFARILKKTAEDLYGVTGKDNEGRKILQELADDLKKYDPDLFTRYALLDVEHYWNQGKRKIVIDDLRFQQEFDALKEAGFIIIGVNCEENTRLERINTLYPDTDPKRFVHGSEVGWRTMNFDYWVDTTDGFNAIFTVKDLVKQSVSV